MATTWTSNVQDVLTAAVNRRDAGSGRRGHRVRRRSGRAQRRQAARRRGHGREADTMFRLMSMTKAFASVAALQLIEQGRLELDQEVASVLPAFGELKVLDGFDGDTPRLREPARQAKIRNLFNHTAGHGYGFCNADLLRYHEVTGSPDPFSGLRACLNVPLVADPGPNGTTASTLIGSARWSRRSAARTSRRISTSMCSSRWGCPTPRSSPSDRAAGAADVRPPTDGGRSSLEVIELGAPAAAPEFWPAGHGAFGTASDYARFLARCSTTASSTGRGSSTPRRSSWRSRITLTGSRCPR